MVIPIIYIHLAMQYYVYEHIRLDNAMPFYIGKGTVKNRRANVSSSKPKAWKDIANIAGFRPRIIKYFESNKEALAFEAEIQPKYAELGITLVNQKKCGLTSGALGYKHKEESLKRISDGAKRNWQNSEFADKISKKSKGLLNPFADHRIHHLWHKYHGFVSDTNYGFRSKYNLLNGGHLSDVFNGKRFDTYGWRLAKNANKLSPKFDTRIFKWVHPVYGERVCIKVDLMAEFPDLDQASLCHMIAGRLKRTKGWTITERPE